MRQYGWRQARSLGLASLALVVAPGCDENISDQDAESQLVTEESERESSHGEVVFESITRTDVDGKQRAATRGALDAHVFQRVARPWSYRDEPYRYNDEAWSFRREDGGIESGYRVTRVARTNRAPAPTAAAAPAPPEVAPELLAELERANAEHEFSIMMEFRDFPDWDVPVLPDLSLLPLEEAMALADEREAAKRRRADTLEAMMAAHLPEATLRSGIKARLPSSGWVALRADKTLLHELMRNPAIARIHGTGQKAQPLGWTLGGGRTPARLDAQQYITNGYTGQHSNFTRHLFGRLTIGIVEPDSFEDEACAFFDGEDCTGASRIARRIRCTDDDADLDICEEITDFTVEEINVDLGSHGTVVASVAAGDYSDGQACGEKVGDSNWPMPPDECHSTTWDDNATGMAPEARLVLVGEVDNVGNNEDFAYPAALVETADLNVDVVSLSWSFGDEFGSSCNANTFNAVESEVENLFDDGVLVVTAAGNGNGDDHPVGSGCNVVNPADIIKTLTVNAFDASTAACTASTLDCLVDQEFSASGPAPTIIDGRTVPNALSLIDVVAPNRFSHHTGATGDFGTVSTGEASGTSVAAPLVAGLATIVKHGYLARGMTWINLPGRLHTIMLAMTDRHFSTDPDNTAVSTVQRTTGSDPNYGLGRVKLRRMEPVLDGPPWAENFTTTSFDAGDPSFSYTPFTSLPAGVELVKCVMLQAEDMSGTKADISAIDLQVEILPSGCGSPASFSRVDAAIDTKSMVAITSADVSLSGKCVKATLFPQFVTTAGITVETFCYYSASLDDEPEAS